MPTVSVICTVKNAQHVISDTIESILKQTYQDWEMIIVDDGSQDQTPAILTAYSQNDKRIKVITTKGIGRGKALNLAIQNSKGKFIANIDADDPSHPDRLKIQVKALNEFREYFMVATDWVLIKGNDRPEWETISKEEINVINITRQLLYRNPINHSSVMFRAEQIKKIGGYDINRSSQFDYDLWVRAVEAKFLLGKIPLKLASKRIHADQSFENKRRIKYLISSHKVQYRAIKMLNGNITHYILFIVRFFYGLLPRFIRSIITHFLSKK
jgi:glycosyltransferase involved in cell wall biosynthesis